MTGSGAPSHATSASGTTEPLSILLLDDHEVVRRGVHDLWDAEPDLTVVGQACGPGSRSRNRPQEGPGTP